MSALRYSVSWNAYEKSICNGFSSLQQRGAYVDMTLAAEGHYVKVHQMVMSLVSPYIAELIDQAACPHPVIFLNRVSYETLQSLLQYAYSGEVVVCHNKIQDFLAVCRDLHVRGLDDCMKPFESSISSELSPSPDNQEMTSLSHTVPRERDRSKDPLDQGPSPLKERSPTDIISSHNVMTTDCPSVGEESAANGKTEASFQTIATEPVEAGARVSYTMSNYGTPQVVLNRYIYSLHYRLGDGGGTWRCASSRARCPAIIQIRNDTIVKRTHAHNHPFHDEQILKRVRKRNIYTSIRDAEDAFAQRKLDTTEQNT